MFSRLLWEGAKETARDAFLNRRVRMRLISCSSPDKGYFQGFLRYFHLSHRRLFLQQTNSILYPFQHGYFQVAPNWLKRMISSTVPQVTI